ncbi:MAG TPA: twin-arginine translocase subunit TatC [Leucothrix mucor]|uniref:Sec-independent protein translocase protein TatC n=1 Tax=Leucothrix mucor TaxID=45248 RepID=A0A7V2SZJ1_LEUMU|nr:twin-arginine translocase subunit TatC [Leucothrix mucor]
MTDKNQSNDNKSAESAEELGFLAHLIELRNHLMRIVISLIIVFLPLAVYAKELFAWFAQPIVSQGLPLISVGVTGPVFVPYKLALLAAFLVALPYIFYQVWAFVAPGLYKHEKKLIFPLLASSVGLFYLGVAFVYYALLPMMFQIMPLFLPVEVTYSPDIASYLDFAIVMFFAFGFAFEMPIATILLISTGMTTAESLAKKRPYVIVGAFIVGMILTPPDMISQVMLAVPMWLLFELGLVLSGVFKKRIKEAVDSRDKIEEERVNSATAMAAGGSAATAVSEAANKLWEDENYEYEEYDDEDDDHQQLTDEELDAELDRIEAEEEAKEKKKAQQAKDLDKPDSDTKK